jgi:hypothetical protein
MIPALNLAYQTEVLKQMMQSSKNAPIRGKRGYRAETADLSEQL